MVKVAYSHRILCDKHFLSWVLNQETSRKREILRKLMFIKSSSLHYTGEHNLILQEEFSDKDFQKLVNEKLKNGDNIHGAVKSCPSPEFLNGEKDMITRLVRYAVFWTNYKPYKACILTDESTEPQYLKNTHYTSLKSTVIVRSNESAVLLIDSFYREFITQRDLIRY